MERKELYEELQMTYEELQHYLIQKYGGAVCDYFVTPECNSKSKKISRTKEGLYCHHIDEDKGANLGNPMQAKLQPFEWQRKERLVYCNVLEHLILHVKIAILRQKQELEMPNDISNFFTTGGIFLICEEINDMYKKDGTSVAWKKKCYEEIKDNYEDYITLVKTILTYIDRNYYGDKDEPAFLVPGSKVHFADCDCEILKITKKKDAFLLKLPTGEEKAYRVCVAMSQFKYVDEMDMIARRMASGYEDFYKDIYNDIVSCRAVELNDYVNALRIDYKGCGYACYADIKLPEKFGAKNADKYIAKALPMYCNTVVELYNKRPIFWNGADIPLDARERFYIVRIETMFNVKEGEEPFIRYREKDFLRNGLNLGMNDNRNFKDNGWTILSTSDVYSRKDNKYYSKYLDRNGKAVNATVILTLGKDDYLLFKERYDIRYLKILDGCYFC